MNTKTEEKFQKVNIIQLITGKHETVLNWGWPSTGHLGLYQVGMIYELWPIGLGQTEY